MKYEGQDGVHATHCCILHGCKYGDDDCPVENKKVEQEYPCQDCHENYNIHTLQEVLDVLNKKIPVCKHCGCANPI